MSALNKYVRNGQIRRFDDGMFRGVELYGTAVYAPGTVGVLISDCARPGELIFYLAGTMFYPTVRGYEAIERSQ